MCSTLRNTLKRGRSVVPMMRLRCRSWIRRRRSSLVLIFMFVSLATRDKSHLGLLRLGTCLPGLFLQHLAGVADAFLLVGIGLAQAPDVRGDLSAQLAIHTRDGDVGLLVDEDVDPYRNVEH